MNDADSLVSAAAHAQRQVTRLLTSAALPDSLSHDATAFLHRLATVSDFAIDTLLRQPTLLPALLAGSGAPLPPPVLTNENRADWPALLRRYRSASS